MEEVRITGTDGLSIGTALAIESLFNLPNELVNPYSDKGKIKPTNYQLFLINVHTLVRNIITSYESKDKLNIIKRSDIEVSVFEVIKTEMFNITELCKTHNLSIMYYCPDYKQVINNGIVRYNDNISFILGKTIGISNYVFKRLIEDEHINNLIGSRDVKIKVPESKILMMTHFPIDLLNYKHWFKCDLLESHTGKLVKSIDFNKKYYKTGSLDTTNYPFHENLLYILGDNHMLKPTIIKLRRYVNQRASVDKWRKDTSARFIKNSISKETDINDILTRARYIF